MLINVTDSNHRRSSEQACFPFPIDVCRFQDTEMLTPCPQDIVGVKTCRSIVVLNGEGSFASLHVRHFPRGRISLWGGL